MVGVWGSIWVMAIERFRRRGAQSSGYKSMIKSTCCSPKRFSKPAPSSAEPCPLSELNMQKISIEVRRLRIDRSATVLDSSNLTRRSICSESSSESGSGDWYTQMLSSNRLLFGFRALRRSPFRCCVVGLICNADDTKSKFPSSVRILSDALAVLMLILRLSKKRQNRVNL